MAPGVVRRVAVMVLRPSARGNDRPPPSKRRRHWPLVVIEGAHVDEDRIAPGRNADRERGPA